MTPLQSAILQLQEDIDAFGQGTKQQPKDGTADWYRLRALVLGQSYLKRLGQLELGNDHEAAESLYRRGNVHFKAADVPLSEPVARETLPDGSLPSGTI